MYNFQASRMHASSSSSKYIMGKAEKEAKAGE